MKMYMVMLMFFLAACQTQHSNVHGQLKQMNGTELERNYTALLKRIHENSHKKTLTDIPPYLENCLRDSIFEYWYGTPWDFNGTTETPRQGNIACGYFVTTTLKHLGLGIDRVFLAQQAASVLIKEICDPLSIKTFSNLSYKKMKTYVQHYNGNIFIAGLDNHVGFMVKDEDGEMYFIHASGIDPHKVVKEKCDESNLLVYSHYHMVGHINFARWAKSVKAAD